MCDAASSARAWHGEPFEVGAPQGFPTNSLAWWWSQRATYRPDEWRLALAVCGDGVLVGVQDVHARDFPQTRRIMTGSWLGSAHQGRGIGTLMRQALLDRLAGHGADGRHTAASTSTS